MPPKKNSGKNKKESLTAIPRNDESWSDQMEISEASGSNIQPSDEIQESITSTPKQPIVVGDQNTTRLDQNSGNTSQRRRSRKGKNKRTSKDDKVERQAKTYTVSDSDLKFYTEKRRISDNMFKHYLSKRIGFECSKVKRRLKKDEIKKLFSSVRTLCFEILNTVKIKKKFNNEKKLVINAVRKSSSDQNISWSDIVKGKRSVTTSTDIRITAKDDKIKRQSDKIKDLENKLKQRDDQINVLQSSIANLTDRINVLEQNERTRKQRDVYADSKKLAARGQPLCNECLPPSAFIYKKPLLDNGDVSKPHAFSKVTCSNCKKVKIMLTKGTFVPCFSWNNNTRKFFSYPEGSILVSNVIALLKNVVKSEALLVKSQSETEITMTDAYVGSMNMKYGINVRRPLGADDNRAFIDGVSPTIKENELFHVFNYAWKNGLIDFDFLTDPTIIL